MKQNRITLKPLAAQRLAQIAALHRKSTVAIVDDLIARQFSFDHDSILGMLEKLNDVDTEQRREVAP